MEVEQAGRFARVIATLWLLARFCLLFLAMALATKSAQAHDCEDVARLKGPVSSVSEEWTPVGPGTTIIWATGPHIAINEERHAARIVNFYTGVTDCTFDSQGRPVRSVTRTRDDKDRWQKVQDLKWRYDKNTITIHDSKSRFSRKLTLNDAGQPVRCEGRGASGSIVTCTFTYRTEEVEMIESEWEVDVGSGVRRVLDINGNILINDWGGAGSDALTYEFDAYGNWVQRHLTVKGDKTFNNFETLTRRTITYQQPSR
jgi:hypothetical protein